MNGLKQPAKGTWSMAWQSAEEAVIGCCFVDGGGTVARALDAGLTVKSFSHPPCAITFQVMIELFAKSGGKAVNIEVVGPELLKRGQLDVVGGYPFLTQITNDHPTTAHAGHFIAEVKEYAARRILASMGRALLEKLDAGIEPDELHHHVAGMLKTLPTETASDGTGLPPVLTQNLLSPALLTTRQLSSLIVPPREHLCGTWFNQGDHGLIVGARGIGKTYFVMELAIGLANGTPVGPWPVAQPRRVCYVDGEMPLDNMRDRIAARDGASDNLTILSHERIFEKTMCAFNLTNRAHQNALLELCKRDKCDVLILDNLSCLFFGMKENEADSWEMVLPWLLAMRRMNVAVILVLHAGRSGTHARGTSKREDTPAWILNLTEATDRELGGGAHFVTRFDKQPRGSVNAEELGAMDWHFTPDNYHPHKTNVKCVWVKSIDIFKQWIKDGLITCGQIADEMKLSPGTISKMAKRGEKEGWLRIANRNYELIE